MESFLEEMNNYGKLGSNRLDSRDPYKWGVCEKDIFLPLYLNNGRNIEVCYDTHIMFPLLRKQMFSHEAAGVNKWTALVQAMYQTNYYQYFKYKIKDEVYKVLMAKGLLLDQEAEKFLLCLTTDHQPNTYLESVLEDDVPDTSRFKLYISDLLVTEDQYAPLYKKVFDLYIKKAIAQGIQVIYLKEKEMQDRFCKHNFNLSFNTLEEQRDHLENDVKGLLM